jgi:hypothetical protein
VTGPQYMCGQVSEQPSICVGRTNGQTVPAFTEPGQHINPALPKIMANRNESECIVVLLNREEYHRSTSRAAKFRKKSWNRTMRSKRLCASKDQTGSGEAALEAPFRRDPAPMHLPDRRYLGLVGTVAAFGFASYVKRMLLWRADFTHAHSFFELFVHGLFGHENSSRLHLPQFLMRICRNTPWLHRSSELLD